MKLNITINRKYAVYVDLTTNLVPFYVGMGNQDRVRQIKRNRKHGGVAKKYGLIRVVIFETDDTEIVKQKEIEVIADCQTFFYDHPDNRFACNFTRGGDGLSGKQHSEETKLRMSKSAMGNTHGQGCKGIFHTAETKEKISKTKTGVPSPHRGKKMPNLSRALKGRIIKRKTRDKISASLKGHTNTVWTTESRQKISSSKTSLETLRIIKDINLIRDRISNGESKISISKDYPGVSPGHFNKIIRNLP